MGKKHPLRVPHPRNIYQDKPNIKELALQFPEFREFAIQSLDGRVTMNFKDKNALRALTKVLLKRDFGLVVDIPEERLVPTVPLRLNYLLWIEDLLLSCSNTASSNVYGIDIGTGASCIYALLAARKNGYSMLATEADDLSFKYACENVIANNLQELVTVKKVTEDTFLCKVLNELEMDRSYDFCMCNPPFFDLQHENESTSPFPPAKDRTGRRLPPKGAPTGTKIELSVPGGEVAFISNLIDDSSVLKDKVKIYTSMVGHRSNVDKLVSRLVKSLEIGKENVMVSAFHQGNVTRWGIAWTFAEDINFYTGMNCGEQLPNQPKRFPKPPVKHVFEDIKIDDAIARVRHLLERIQVKKKVIEKRDGEYGLELTTYEETWKNQRKRRREEERRKMMSEGGKELKKIKKNECDFSTRTDLGDGETHSQRKNLVDKCETDTLPVKEKVNNAPSEVRKEGEMAVLQAVMLLKNVGSDDENKVVVEMSSIGGTGGWNAVHQILTYLKNHWHRNL